MDTKNNAIKNVTLILLTIIMLMIGLIAKHLGVKLVSFTGITVIILYYSKLEVLNPIFWFTTLLFLYGVPNSIVSMIFYGKTVTEYYSDIDLSMIAMSIFFFSFFLNSTILEKRNINNVVFRFSISKKMAGVVLLFLIIFNITFLLYLRYFGIDTKLELMNTGIIYSLYTNLNILYYFIISMYFAYRINENKKFILRFGFIIILNLIIYSYTGERDIIVFPVISLLLLFGYKKFKFIKLRQFIPALAIGVMSLPLLLNFGVRNSGGGSFLNFENFLYRIFSSELICASKNIDLILSDNSFSPLGLIIPFSIIVNSFIELPLFPSILNFHGVSWFTQKYYYYLPEGAGAGFSLIAEGYMFAGTIGVIIWFAFIANLLFYMYKSINNNLMALNIYVVMVPIIMYSIRGGLETIFIYLVRILIFYLLLFVVDQILFSKWHEKEIKIRTGN